MNWVEPNLEVPARYLMSSMELNFKPDLASVRHGRTYRVVCFFLSFYISRYKMQPLIHQHLTYNPFDLVDFFA
jgi:hypothetical protein